MKKLILFILLCLPVFINAACDRELHQTYAEYAKDISYDTNYSVSQSKFTVTLYNVISEMNVRYNGRKLNISNNEIVIGNISEGTFMEISIYGNDGCSDPVRTITITQPYYNRFFGTSICNGYEDKITYCSHKFTDDVVTEKLIKTAIENYEHVLEIPEEEPEEPPLTRFQVISRFATKWGVRIMLVLITAFLTNLYFNDKYIKIKHKL